MKFLDPKNDIAFKKIFGNEHHKNLTISFLNNVLNLSGNKEIKDVTFRETAKLPDRIKGKKIYFDVYCIDKGNNHYIIEMQSLNEYNFVERSEFYIARALMSQLNKGKNYQILLPVVFVGIVDFALFDELDSKSNVAHEKKDVISHYSMRNDVTGERLKKSRQFLHYIELSKFNKTLDQLATLTDKWFYFLKHADTLKDVPKALQDLKEAFNILDTLQWNDADLQDYTLEQEIIDRERRQQEGSYQEGINKGAQEGAQEKAEAVALNALKNGLDIAVIAMITDLSIKEIDALRKKIK